MISENHFNLPVEIHNEIIVKSLDYQMSLESDIDNADEVKGTKRKSLAITHNLEFGLVCKKWKWLVENLLRDFQAERLNLFVKWRKEDKPALYYLMVFGSLPKNIFMSDFNKILMLDPEAITRTQMVQEQDLSLIRHLSYSYVEGDDFSLRLIKQIFSRKIDLGEGIRNLESSIGCLVGRMNERLTLFEDLEKIQSLDEIIIQTAWEIGNYKLAFKYLAHEYFLKTVHSSLEFVETLDCRMASIYRLLYKS